MSCSALIYEEKKDVKFRELHEAKAPHMSKGLTEKNRQDTISTSLISPPKGGRHRL